MKMRLYLFWNVLLTSDMTILLLTLLYFLLFDELKQVKLYCIIFENETIITKTCWYYFIELRSYSNINKIDHKEMCNENFEYVHFSLMKRDGFLVSSHRIWLTFVFLYGDCRYVLSSKKNTCKIIFRNNSALTNIEKIF